MAKRHKVKDLIELIKCGYELLEIEEEHGRLCDDGISLINDIRNELGIDKVITCDIQLQVVLPKGFKVESDEYDTDEYQVVITNKKGEIIPSYINDVDSY